MKNFNESTALENYRESTEEREIQMSSGFSEESNLTDLTQNEKSVDSNNFLYVATVSSIGIIIFLYFLLYLFTS